MGWQTHCHVITHSNSSFYTPRRIVFQIQSQKNSYRYCQYRLQTGPRKNSVSCLALLSARFSSLHSKVLSDWPKTLLKLLQ